MWHPLREGNINMSSDETLVRPAPPHRGLLARHPLISFFVLAFAFSWIAWSPWYLSEAGIGLLPFDAEGISGLLNVAALVVGPTLSAFIVTGVTEGRAGVRHLARRIVRWRVGLVWYLFVLIGIPLIMLLGAILLPGTLTSFDATSMPSGLTYLGFFVLVTFLGGPLFEEIGWRGFALPYLQPLRGPLVASLILGLVWALWHLPLFWYRPGTRPTAVSSTSLSSSSSPRQAPSSSRGFSTTRGAAC